MGGRPGGGEKRELGFGFGRKLVECYDRCIFLQTRSKGPRRRTKVSQGKPRERLDFHANFAHNWAWAGLLSLCALREVGAKDANHT